VTYGWTDGEGHIFIGRWAFYFHPKLWRLDCYSVELWNEVAVGPFSVLRTK
jgi:hypothetical protein